MIDPDAQLQLTATANAADRANRPTRFVVFAVAVLVVAAVYLAASVRVFERAKETVANAQYEDLLIGQLLAQLTEIVGGGADIAALYPKDFFVETKIIDSWKAAGIDFSPQPIVSDRVSQSVPQNPRVQRYDATCSVNQAPVEDVLRWMTAALEHEDLAGKLFVSQATFNPITPEWNASFRLSWYEVR